MDFLKNLTPNFRFVLNILIPSSYFLIVAIAYFGPKNFGFGFPAIVLPALIVGFLGLILWVVSMMNLGSSFAVLPGSKQLVNRGVYKYIRHPMYCGINVTLGGLVIASGSYLGLIVYLVLAIPLNIIRSRWEERALLEEFGDSYIAYKKNTWF
jgi:protein-S-isoprenylcysteine O-methyltransferase Ste14